MAKEIKKDDFYAAVIDGHNHIHPLTTTVHKCFQLAQQMCAERDEEIKNIKKDYGTLSNNYCKVFAELKQLKSMENLLRNIGQQAMDEREVLIKAFDAVRKEFKGRTWLMEGRGCYPYNDDRYKEEVRYIMDAFNEINKNVWKEIKSKTFEYRNIIEKPLLEKISKLESQLKSTKSKAVLRIGRFILYEATGSVYNGKPNIWLKTNEGEGTTLDLEDLFEREM